MYSYQHRYHAGNAADLHKHIILLALLHTLLKKDSPFCVLDSFAGEGFYDLNSPESKKTKEYESGFSLLKKLKNPPPLIQKLTKLAAGIQETQTYYPGSPYLIYSHLRSQDTGLFLENHPQAYQILTKNFNRYKNIHIHKRDAFEGLLALTPFKETRGLIFIDPSYEVKTEYAKVAEWIPKVYKKCQHIIFQVWYPILKEDYHNTLLHRLRESTIPKMWCTEWHFNTSSSIGIQGSGTIIINPPWQIDHELSENFASLKQTIYPESDWKQFFLNP